MALVHAIQNDDVPISLSFCRSRQSLSLCAKTSDAVRCFVQFMFSSHALYVGPCPTGHNASRRAVTLSMKKSKRDLSPWCTQSTFRIVRTPAFFNFLNSFNEILIVSYCLGWFYNSLCNGFTLLPLRESVFKYQRLMRYVVQRSPSNGMCKLWCRT